MFFYQNFLCLRVRGLKMITLKNLGQEHAWQCKTYPRAMDKKTKPNEIYTFVTNMSMLNEDNHNSCEEYNEYQNLRKTQSC